MEKKGSLYLAITTNVGEFNTKGFYLDKDNSKLFTFRKSKYGNKVDNSYKANLYLLSFERVVDGDYCMCIHIGGVPINGEIHRVTDEIEKNQTYQGYYVSKIIASTDNNLVYLIKNHNDFDSEIPLPKFSDEFLEKYIKTYNLGIQMFDVDYCIDMDNDIVDLYKTSKKSKLDLEYCNHTGLLYVNNVAFTMDMVDRLTEVFNTKILTNTKQFKYSITIKDKCNKAKVSISNKDLKYIERELKKFPSLAKDEDFN